MRFTFEVLRKRPTSQPRGGRKEERSLVAAEANLSLKTSSSHRPSIDVSRSVQFSKAARIHLRPAGRRSSVWDLSFRRGFYLWRSSDTAILSSLPAKSAAFGPDALECVPLQMQPIQDGTDGITAPYARGRAAQTR